MTQTARLLFFTAVCFAFGFFLKGWLPLLAALPIAWDLLQTYHQGRNSDTNAKMNERITELQNRLSSLASNIAPRGF